MQKPKKTPKPEKPIEKPAKAPPEDLKRDPQTWRWFEQEFPDDLDFFDGE